MTPDQFAALLPMLGIWMTAGLATGVTIIRRAAGPRAIRVADSVAGLGLVGFGGALAYGAVHDR